jgi:hypothetical protein
MNMNSAIATPRRRHRILRRLCELVLLLTSFVSLYTCPHSKVEESFNLQASHDLFYYGLGPAWTLSSWRRHWRRGGGNDGDSASCDGAAGGRGQAETCSSRIGSDILPYDHVNFPGGRLLICGRVPSFVISSHSFHQFIYLRMHNITSHSGATHIHGGIYSIICREDYIFHHP